MHLCACACRDHRHCHHPAPDRGVSVTLSGSQSSKFTKPMMCKSTNHVAAGELRFQSHMRSGSAPGDWLGFQPRFPVWAVSGGVGGEQVGACSPHRDRSGPTGSAGRVWPPSWALPRPLSVDANLGASVDDAGSLRVPVPGVGLSHPPAFHSCLCAASPSPLPGSVP